jgi:Cd2+/Zn2+-exporting ATPase
MEHGAHQQTSFHVSGMDCDCEAGRIRRGLGGIPGVATVEALPSSGHVSVSFDPRVVSPDRLRDELRRIGFQIREPAAAAQGPRFWADRKVLSSAASGLLVLAGWIASAAGAPEVVSTAAWLVAVVVGGWYFGREAFEELWHDRRVGIELLMSVATIAAVALGRPMEGAMLVFLYSISEAVEGYTERKTRSAVRALMNLAPRTALVKRDGTEVETQVENLSIGDVFVVRPGQSLPTDGRVLAGESAVDESPVTGESIPVDKQPGSVVFAGTLNGQGVIEVEATKPFAENTLSRIIRMVQEAQERKGRGQQAIERFGHFYSPLILGAGVAIALLVPLVTGDSFAEWAVRATVFIVAAAPCSLVISTPVTMVAALGTAARHGVLVKGGIHLEELGRVDAVAFDKTGTLTHGRPEVTDVVPLDAAKTGARDLLALAAAAERYSEHPIARAITRRAQADAVHVLDAGGSRALTGAGVLARVDGRTVRVGRPTLFADEPSVDQEMLATEVSRLEAQGKTVVVVGDPAPIGLIAVRDEPRPNAATALVALRRAGARRLVMLSGDSPVVATVLGGALGIDEVHGGLKPDDKVAQVRALAHAGYRVAMVGDGINDAPALAEASVGIAMGAAGTDVALETADVALMSDNLDKVAWAVRHAHRTRAVVRQNIAFSVVVVGALIAGAIGGWFSLPVAVTAHELSEFAVIASGLRMLRG